MQEKVWRLSRPASPYIKRHKVGWGLCGGRGTGRMLARSIDAVSVLCCTAEQQRHTRVTRPALQSGSTHDTVGTKKKQASMPPATSCTKAFLAPAYWWYCKQWIGTDRPMLIASRRHVGLRQLEVCWARIPGCRAWDAEHSNICGELLSRCQEVGRVCSGRGVCVGGGRRAMWQTCPISMPAGRTGSFACV
jgi:hypothetical protein